MKASQAYKILVDSGFSKENVQALVEVFSDPIDSEHLATKGDLKELEIRILNEIHSQTWKFLSGMALLGIIFKLADLFIHIPK